MVTGAAGGLGAGLARELHGRGFRLALVDRDAAGLAVLAAGLGDSVSMHDLDLADAEAVARLPAELGRQHPTIDVLVCASGVAVAAPVDRLRPADLRWQMDNGFLAAAWPVQTLLPLLRSRPRAAIGIVGSAFASLAAPTKAGYCAAKAALRAFTEALAMELRGSSVTVTELVPGPLATGLAKHGRADSQARLDAEDQFLRRHGQVLPKVARTAVTAVLSGRSRVFLDPRVRIADLAARWLPVACQRALVGRVARRLQFLGPEQSGEPI